MTLAFVRGSRARALPARSPLVTLVTLVAALAVCAALALLVCAGTLGAQVDPRGPVRTIRTAHFRVHFAPPHEALARRAAAYAEHAWSQFAAELAEPDVPVELLVADNVDVTNGFATSFPTNRITVYALPPVFTPELRHYDDWLQLVITHELAHVFHIDRARGWWAAGRKLFGRNPVLFPNSLLPRWIVEGLAVHYETRFTGSGRLASTEFPMIARTAALAGRVPPPSAWSLATSRFPLGQHAYGYGALLMSRLDARARAERGDSTGMRRFIDEVAGHPVPWRFDRAARAAFGAGVNESWRGFRDSLAATVDAVHAWSAAHAAEQLVAPGMQWFAEQPRWETDSTVLLVMNDGHDVSGLYRAHVPMAGAITLDRLSRRNSLDANAITPDSGLVFAQLDLDDPFTLRSRLWRTSPAGEETELAGTRRLFQPHVRAQDGTVVALRAIAGTTELVLMAPNGDVRTLAAATLDTAWAEPRWSPDGTTIAAVRLLRGGVQQVVLLDTLGTVRRVMFGARGITSLPTFTPDGAQLLWATDVLGSAQIAAAPVVPLVTSAAGSAADGCSADDCEPAFLTRSPTGITAPAVSPDGTRVAALEYTLTGWRLVVFPLPAIGAPAVRLPHSIPYRARSMVVEVAPDSSASRPYRALRQLLPHWWTPIVGEGSDGAATFGLASSGVDILRRHAWTARATWHPARQEFEGNAGYRYAALPRTAGWQPFADLFGVQSWDRFAVFDSTRRVVGELQRVNRIANAALTMTRPRVRTSASLALGVQIETRRYATTPDTLIRGLNPVFARGRNLPAVFLSGAWGNTMRAGRAISAENGVTVSGSLLHGWQSGPEQRGSWRATGSARGYRAFGSSQFARQVVAVRVSGGLTDRHAATELSVGGTSGTLATLLPGVLVGDPSRLLPVRGFVPGVQRGTRAVSGTVEYRAPVALLARGVGLTPLFVDRISLTAFADAGRAWCGASDRVSPGGGSLCLPNAVRDGWLAATGAELALDLGAPWDTPWRARLGAAQPIVRPADVSRRGTVYFTLGASF